MSQVCRRLEAGDPHVHTHQYGDAMLKEDFAADSRSVGTRTVLYIEYNIEWPSVVQSRLCGWSYLVKFLIKNLSYSP